ncbi:MAG: repressor LexA, partial [Bradymonadia bacterium]
MKGLTQRQLQVLEAIANSLSESGYPPTIREIGNSLGIRSTNGVNDHLKALEKKGYIERDTSKSRAIQMTSLATHELGLDTSAGAANADREGPSNEGVAVPLLGRIAAGLPLDAADAAEDHVVVDPGMFGRAGSNNVFALRVKGESMIEDGILDGDVI